MPGYFSSTCKVCKEFAPGKMMDNGVCLYCEEDNNMNKKKRLLDNGVFGILLTLLILGIPTILIILAANYFIDTWVQPPNGEINHGQYSILNRRLSHDYPEFTGLVTNAFFDDKVTYEEYFLLLSEFERIDSLHRNKEIEEEFNDHIGL